MVSTLAEKQAMCRSRRDLGGSFFEHKNQNEDHKLSARGKISSAFVPILQAPHRAEKRHAVDRRVSSLARTWIKNTAANGFDDGIIQCA